MIARGIFTYISGCLLAIATVTNSEVFWDIFGKDFIVIMSALLLPASLIPFLIGINYRKIQLIKPLLHLSYLFALITFGLLIYYLFNEIYSEYLFRGIYSALILFVFSACDIDERLKSTFLKAYLMILTISAFSVMLLQGEKDSIGNILSLLVMASFLYNAFSNNNLSVLYLIGVLALTFIFGARTATALCLLALLLLFLKPLFIETNSGLFKFFKLMSFVVVFFLYFLTVYIACYSYDNLILNEILTYRPLLWHTALAGLDMSNSYVLPSDYLFDIAYFSGEEVYNYYGWISDVKSYSAHSFLMANINRWGLFCTLIMFSILCFSWLKSYSYMFFCCLMIAMINGVFSTVMLGTSNMYGVFIIIIFVVFKTRHQSEVIKETI